MSPSAVPDSTLSPPDVIEPRTDNSVTDETPDVPDPLETITHLSAEDRSMINAVLLLHHGPITVRMNPLFQLEAKTVTVNSTDDVAALLHGKKQEECAIVVRRLREVSLELAQAVTGKV